MDEDYRIWLLDQHPRGAQILAQMEQSEDNSALSVEEPEDVPPYTEWSVEDLRAEAEARGLKKSGNRQELAARLDAHDAEASQ